MKKKKSMTNLKKNNTMEINKKNQKDKEPIDLNSTGTKSKSLLKPQYPKPQRKFFPSLMDKNSWLSWQS